MVASCVEDGPCWILNLFAITRSLTKCMSSLTCFVLACSKWLWDSRTALRSSHSKVGDRVLIFSSVGRDYSHTNPYLVCAKTLNSASALDLPTKNFFLKLHKIKFGPIKVRYQKHIFYDLDHFPSLNHCRLLMTTLD